MWWQLLFWLGAIRITNCSANISRFLVSRSLGVLIPYLSHQLESPAYPLLVPGVFCWFFRLSTKAIMSLVKRQFYFSFQSICISFIFLVLLH
jgi:hypothetical protein